MLILKTLFWLAFIIGLVIFIHELGHFVTAKFLHIKVEEFAFGFGKKIFGKKMGETLYRINLIPYGGYVKLLGEESASKDPRSFSTKPLLTRSIVIIGGVVMNFLLAAATFYVLLSAKDFSIFLPRISEYKFLGSETEIQDKPIVEGVIEDTPASEVDFPTDVVIWSVDNEEIVEVDDFVGYLEGHKGQEVEIEVLSFEGEWKKIMVAPRETEREGVLLGVEFYDVIASFYKLDYGRNKALSGAFHSVNFSGYTLDIFKELIAISFKEKSVKPVSEGVSGVVGVADRVFDLVRVGDVLEILNLSAGVNLSVAIINLMPIPGLDGGYLLFMIIEKIRGRKLAEKYMEWAMRIGFVLIIILGILITVKDIVQFDIIPRFINFVKGLF